MSHPNSKSMQANARVFKHYRSKFMKAIADTIKDKFDAAYLRDKNDPTAFLENLGWVYQDLIVIERDVVACFPQDWDIYSYFVREYHKTLNATIQRLVASDPDATALLKLHAWLKEYKSRMKSSISHQNSSSRHSWVETSSPSSTITSS